MEFDKSHEETLADFDIKGECPDFYTLRMAVRALRSAYHDADMIISRLQERSSPLHASSPEGHKCADCSIDGEACPECYAAWWQKRHPNVVLPEAPSLRGDPGGLPVVAGRMMVGTIADLEQSARVLIGREFTKPLSDNSLIMTLAEAVRMGREYSDAMQGKVASEPKEGA